MKKFCFGKSCDLVCCFVCVLGLNMSFPCAHIFLCQKEISQNQVKFMISVTVQHVWCSEQHRLSLQGKSGEWSKQFQSDIYTDQRSQNPNEMPMKVQPQTVQFSYWASAELELVVEPLWRVVVATQNFHVANKHKLTFTPYIIKQRIMDWTRLNQ